MANYWQPSGLSPSPSPFLTLLLSYWLPIPDFILLLPLHSPHHSSRDHPETKGLRNGTVFLVFLLLLCISFHFLVLSYSIFITLCSACHFIPHLILRHIVAPHKNAHSYGVKELPTSRFLPLQPMPLWVLGLLPPPVPCFLF